jgi:GPI mannosyltransferase 2
MTNQLRAVTLLAMSTRLCVLVVSVLSDWLVEDYDTSAHRIKSAGPIGTLLGGLGVWDGVYFQRIASHGYEYEQVHAFFPLLSWTMRYFSLIVCGGEDSDFDNGACRGSSLVRCDELRLLVGVLVSNLFFVLSARELYRLGSAVFGEQMRQKSTRNVAYVGALLYCVTPAGVFMSAVYTESLFAYFSLLALRFVAQRRCWAGAAAIAVAGFARSNAMTLAVFLVADRLRRTGWPRLDARVLALYAATALQCVLAIAPFVANQAYAWSLYCGGGGGDARRPWCDNMPPSVYAFVQSEYWGNGFLRYWQLRQLPNFALATPMIGVALFAAARYARVALASSSLRAAWHIEWLPLIGSGGGKSSTAMDALDRCHALLPYVAYWALMALINALFMHVQIATRFLCAMPALYWHAAAASLHSNAVRRVVLAYFIVYTLAGSILFPNFYPWT